MEINPDLLSAFQRCRVLVIGDLMLDEYLWGHIQRISPEAPVPILNLVQREYTLGGAGNVVKNLRALGAQVTTLGAVGADATGEQILSLLNESGVDQRGVLRDPSRRSSRKTRLMSLEHGQQVFRLDEESAHSIDQTVEDALLAKLEAILSDVDAVLCSDYLKGVLTERFLQVTFQMARSRNLPLTVAPKDSNPGKYRGAGILVPNASELAQLARTARDGNEWLFRAASELIGQLEVQALLVTRGGEGMSLFEPAAGLVRRLDIPTMARSVYDVTGAGDTVVSVFTLAVAAGADRETAAHLANLAAGIVVGKRGTASVTVQEIQERLKDLQSLMAESKGITSACSAS